MKPIHRLAYASTFNIGRVESAPVALRDILSTSRRNNAEYGVTGYLIFDGETFLQVLEGSKEAVTATITRMRPIRATDRSARCAGAPPRIASSKTGPWMDI